MQTSDHTPKDQPVRVDAGGHIARPLPATKTVAEAVAKRAAETGDKTQLAEQDPVEAGASLLKYNDEVLARLTQVNDYFKPKNLGKPLDPTQAKAFTDFVRDHLAYVNMRFVTLGRFDRPGAEDPNTKSGFVTASEGDLPTDPTLDPFLRTMRSAQLAIQSGANLTGDGEPEPA